MLESKAAALKLAKGDHDGAELVALEGLLKTNSVTFLNYLKKNAKIGKKFKLKKTKQPLSEVYYPIIL
jgi:hypothetical protein